ncbi:hypothetical protein A0H81_03526 [Grifola frondosa]|uniref:Malonyl-CoA:ACP transacylase (MAT) domain-containing protein n=1 Tax=Grifola frondosa TaxID=5627 RepID=A0A1C7M4Y1_GRIFR|nr:hypothetical protein A0H81_08309 [Grifola frondosa]OBZ77142.1 hypothetical protein A0H81_03526 [Grifola frondosa]
MAVTGCSAAELLTNLHDVQTAAVVPQKGGEQAKALFAFSGQGGQYVGMGAELGRRGGCGERRGIPGVPEHSPDAVAGHSLGKYAAQVTAWVLKLDDALRLVAVRGPEFKTVAACIDIGPHPMMFPMLRCLQGHAGAPLLLPSLRKNASEFAVLCAALAGLYALPIANDIAWSSTPSRLSRRPPAVSFRRHALFGDLRPQAAAALTLILPKPRFSLFDSCVGMPSAEGVDGVFETPISQLADLVEGHKVSGFALCPPSVYHKLALAGMQHVLERLVPMPTDAVLDLVRITYSTCSSTLRVSHARSYTTDGEHQPYCTGVFSSS